MARRPRRGDEIQFEDLRGNVAEEQFLDDDDDPFGDDPDDDGGGPADPFADDPDWMSDANEPPRRRQKRTEDADEDDDEGEGEEPDEAEDEGEDEVEYASAEEVEPEQEDVDDQSAEFDDEDLKRIKDPRLRAAIKRDREELANLRQQNESTSATVRYYQHQLLRNRSGQIDSAIAGKQAELEQAIEEGDAKAQARLHTEISELQASKRELSTVAQRANMDLSKDPEPPKPQQAAAEGPTPRNEKAKAFQKKHPWIGDARHKDRNDALMTIDRNLYEEGYDPTSDAYFTEMERRLVAKFPELRQRQRTMTRNQGPSGVNRGSTPNNRQRSPVRGNRVLLTKEDRDTMRTFGLDPNNKAEARAFAKEKMASERSGRRAR